LVGELGLLNSLIHNVGLLFFHDSPFAQGGFKYVSVISEQAIDDGSVVALNSNRLAILLKPLELSTDIARTRVP